jgi:hypothetical protein
VPGSSPTSSVFHLHVASGISGRRTGSIGTESEIERRRVKCWRSEWSGSTKHVEPDIEERRRAARPLSFDQLLGWWEELECRVVMGRDVCPLKNRYGEGE